MDCFIEILGFVVKERKHILILMIVSENIQKVSDLIKDDLSLERIKDIKEQLSKEKSTIEYQLGKESEHYYGLVEESLSLLRYTQ